MTVAAAGGLASFRSVTARYCAWVRGWREDASPGVRDRLPETPHPTHPAFEVTAIERLLVHGRFGNPVEALQEVSDLLPGLSQASNPDAVLVALYARALLVRLSGAPRTDAIAACTMLESAAADAQCEVWVATACALRARARLEAGEPAAAMGDLARIDIDTLTGELGTRAGFRMLDATATAYARLRLTERVEHVRDLLEGTIATRDVLDRATHWATWSAELAARAMEPVARGAAEPDVRLLDRAVELAERVISLGVTPVPEPLRRSADGVRALAAAFRGQPSEALRLLGSDAFGEPRGLHQPESQLVVIAAIHAHTLVGSHATARSLDDSIRRSVGALPNIVLEVCRARQRIWLERRAGEDSTRMIPRLTDLLVRLSWQSMELAAETARQALEHQTLHAESRTDALTGVGNRRALDEELHAMLRFAELPLSMVVVDIDDFKRVNDEYTHLIGDQVLRQVAGTLLESLGPGDRLLRYGGDEFVVLLPGTSDQEARLAAEAMTDAIHAYPWDAVAAGLRVKVTTGCAALWALTGRRPAADAARLFRRADEALLEAKRQARAALPVQNPQPSRVTAPESPALGTPASPLTEVLDLRDLPSEQSTGGAHSHGGPGERARRRPGRRAAVIDLSGREDPSFSDRPSS
jgi:diguanylate cyclase (GGDEF)-like protein